MNSQIPRPIRVGRDDPRHDLGVHLHRGEVPLGSSDARLQVDIRGSKVLNHVRVPELLVEGDIPLSEVSTTGRLRA